MEAEIGLLVSKLAFFGFLVYAWLSARRAAREAREAREVREKEAARAAAIPAPAAAPGDVKRAA